MKNMISPCPIIWHDFCADGLESLVARHRRPHDCTSTLEVHTEALASQSPARTIRSLRGLPTCSLDGTGRKSVFMNEHERGTSMDGLIKSHGDAILRAAVIGVAIVIAWNVPYITHYLQPDTKNLIDDFLHEYKLDNAWYWRIVTFLGILFLGGIIYPARNR
jgi:hypothetical protein